MLIKDLLESQVVNIPTYHNVARILNDYKTSPYYPDISQIPNSSKVSFIAWWNYHWAKGLDRYLKSQGLKNSLQRIKFIKQIVKDYNPGEN